MKKESGFKLKSGNKPSPAKFFRRFLKSANPARGVNRAGKTFKGLLRGEKSGSVARPRNMGAASMLGGPRIGPGSGGSMIGGAVSMLGGRRRRRSGSPNMASRVARAIGIRPIAGRALGRRR